MKPSIKKIYPTYHCKHCGAFFDDPGTDEREFHYVVNGDHDAYALEEVEVCPECLSMNFEESYLEFEDEDEGEE